MKKLTSQILPLIALAVIVSPLATSRLQREEAPRPDPVVRLPDPTPVKPVTDPETWFEVIQPHCTPSEVTLATDLNRPPEGVEGTGYKAACFALARAVPRARALLLGLPQEDRIRGASLVYEVAQGLAADGRHDSAGPLMELVLEFWPNHYLALYEAGRARFASGDFDVAQGYLGRFLEVYFGHDELVANANRVIGDMAQR